MDMNLQKQLLLGEDNMIYDVAKSLIEKKEYDVEQMKADLSLFKMFNVITNEEYIELMELIHKQNK